MKTPPFLVIADRGRMKAYETHEPLEGGCSLRVLEDIQMLEPHQKFEARYTDRAGAFPAGASAGNSSGERLNLESETRLRIFRQLAEKLTEWLKKHGPRRWAFAAPSEINDAILNGLDADLKGRLVKNLRADLVNVPTHTLLRHFDRE